MPLLDHFHAPLYPEHQWEAFHSGWANEIRRLLNRTLLPEGYFAEANVHVGGRVEVDVATLQRRTSAPDGNGSKGGVAVETWAPPMASLFMPAVFPDEFEVQIFSVGGRTLVAAIELVSPGNKDRPEARRMFAAKCVSYLQAGIGLLVVDIVSNYLANLHDELVDVMRQPETFRFPGEASLYATAYRPQRTNAGDDQIALWCFPVAISQSLPIVPLAVRGGPTLPIDLELTYTEVREGSRL